MEALADMNPGQFCDAESVLLQGGTIIQSRFPQHTSVTGMISGMGEEGTFETSKTIDESTFAMSGRGAATNGNWFDRLIASDEMGANKSSNELNYNVHIYEHDMAYSNNTTKFQVLKDWYYHNGINLDSMLMANNSSTTK
jgi:hypothetical protein